MSPPPTRGAAFAGMAQKKGPKGSGEDSSDAEVKKGHGSVRGAFTLACRRATRDLLRWVDFGIEFGVQFFSIFMKILGPCLICLALSLIGFVAYTYFVHFLPSFEAFGVSGKVCLTSFGMFLLLNTLYNYAKSILMDPGTPPEFEEAMKQRETGEEELGTRPKPRQCNRCTKLKPPRTHHCSVCRRCILKMDHHCPWINNCVGWRNYRHFCLFLMYMASICCFIVCCFFGPFTETMVFHRRRINGISRSGRQCIMTSFMICCSILVALCILGGFHVYLVLTNQTTIEFQMNLVRRREARKNGEYFRNPYDLGRTRNFQQVFGPNRFWAFRWLIAWGSVSLPPTGDGMSYPSLNRLSG